MVGLRLGMVLLEEMQERIGTANFARRRGSRGWSRGRIGESGLSSIVRSELRGKVGGGSGRLRGSGLLECLDGSNMGILGLDIDNSMSMLQ